MRQKTSGTKVNAEIFVKIAKPKKMPESKSVSNRSVFSKSCSYLSQFTLELNSFIYSVQRIISTIREMATI